MVKFLVVNANVKLLFLCFLSLFSNYNGFISTDDFKSRILS